MRARSRCGPAIVPGERRDYFAVLKNGIPGTVNALNRVARYRDLEGRGFLRNVRATASYLVVRGDIEKGMMVFSGAGGCVRCHMIPRPSWTPVSPTSAPRFH
ncbi:MAG: hypothetical protein JWN34_617 [Bryobacterales bacterium]|nr:hypothetical protein [Bryobacterales bacterium]